MTTTVVQPSNNTTSKLSSWVKSTYDSWFGLKTEETTKKPDPAEFATEIHTDAQGNVTGYTKLPVPKAAWWPFELAARAADPITELVRPLGIFGDRTFAEIYAGPLLLYTALNTDTGVLADTAKSKLQSCSSMFTKNLDTLASSVPDSISSLSPWTIGAIAAGTAVAGWGLHSAWKRTTSGTDKTDESAPPVRSANGQSGDQDGTSSADRSVDTGVNAKSSLHIPATLGKTASILRDQASKVISADHKPAVQPCVQL